VCGQALHKLGLTKNHGLYSKAEALRQFEFVEAAFPEDEPPRIEGYLMLHRGGLDFDGDGMYSTLEITLGMHDYVHPRALSGSGYEKRVKLISPCVEMVWAPDSCRLAAERD